MRFILLGLICLGSLFIQAQANNQITSNYQIASQSVTAVSAKHQTSLIGDHLSSANMLTIPWWKKDDVLLATFSSLLLGIVVLATYAHKLKRSAGALSTEDTKEIPGNAVRILPTRLYHHLAQEFRTPLTVIMGMVEQMQEAPKKYFEEGARLIALNGQQLLAQINHLLDLSKLEDRSYPLELQQADIVAYVRFLKESLQAYTNKYNFTFQLHLQLDQLVMDYDPELLQKILSNLLSYTAKFNPSGSSIVLQLSRQENELAFQIKNIAGKIPTEALQQDFKSFHIAEYFSQEKQHIDVALAYAKAAVELMGGNIEIQSDQEQGIVFTFRLPIRQEAPQAFNISDRENLPGLATSLASPTKTEVVSTDLSNGLPSVLIIEDNYDVVTYLKSCLKGAYTIDIAFNGMVGIEKAIKNLPDLIICDATIPDKSGYEICAFLKNENSTSHIPFILLSSKTEVSAKIEALKKGADVYLTKPFKKEELLVQSEMILARQKKLADYYAAQSQSDATPEAIGLSVAGIKQDLFIQKVLTILEANFTDEYFGLPQLASQLGLSRSQLFRKMKSAVNVSPSQYIRSFRLTKAKNILETTDSNVTEVAWKTGFSDPSHFSKLFKETYGFNPSKMKQVG